MEKTFDDVYAIAREKIYDRHIQYMICSMLLSSAIFPCHSDESCFSLCLSQQFISPRLTVFIRKQFINI